MKSAGANRRRQLLILCGGIALSLLLLVIRPSPSEAKATWLWNTKLIQQNGEDIIHFAKKQRIKVIFLQISGDVKEESYRHFVRLASSEGLEVHALNGQPEWALQKYQQEAKDFLEWVKEYNRKAAPEEKFTGVQFDVEPYLLDNWETRKASIVEQWVENIRVWVEAGKGSDFEIGAAVPFWLNDINYPGSKARLNQWMLEKFDYVAIMSYRDEADRIYQAARATLEEGDRKKKQVWVGVEVGKSKEGPGVSFHEKPFVSLIGEMNKLVKLVKDHSSFAGIAVHSYEPWRNKQGLWERSLKE